MLTAAAFLLCCTMISCVDMTRLISFDDDGENWTTFPGRFVCLKNSRSSSSVFCSFRMEHHRRRRIKYKIKNLWGRNKRHKKDQQNKIEWIFSLFSFSSSCVHHHSKSFAKKGNLNRQLERGQQLRTSTDSSWHFSVFIIFFVSEQGQKLSEITTKWKNFPVEISFRVFES